MIINGELACPVLFDKDSFLYSFMITPLIFEDEFNLKTIENLPEDNDEIIITPFVEEDIKKQKSCVYGVYGNIIRKVLLPDNRVKILFQGAYGVKIHRFENENIAFYTPIDKEIQMPSKSKTLAFVRILKETCENISKITNMFSEDMLKTIQSCNDPLRLVEIISSLIHLDKEVALKIVLSESFEYKCEKILEILREIIESCRIEQEIKTKVHQKIEKNNREYFLKEQLKQIQNELGNNKNGDLTEYKDKLELKKPFMNKDAFEEIEQQILKLGRINVDSTDASMIQSYLDWALEIPFEVNKDEHLSIKDVEKQLNKDHFSITKPKERIVEYFSLRSFLQKRNLLKKRNNSTILCFYGPPGVGKTSLANSIASALKKSLVRVALGGIEDVSELRGHRRTYVGAMPGRIIQGLIEAKQMNPVVVLDEIDKLGFSHRGDPTAVLLEILDPEQNSHFRDHFLNFNVDLSNIIFIATANDISQIPAPLRDRMEFIELSSYTPQEKFQIAKHFLIPQELEKHGLKNDEISISNEAIEEIIEKYTRESGVRNLRRKIAGIFRKITKNMIFDKKIKKTNITKRNLNDFLDKKIFEPDEIDKENNIGIVNGLAWTAVGGVMLKIETIKIRGKGEMKITGQLGDVMKESSQIAFSVIKTLIDEHKLKVPLGLIPRLQDEKIAPTSSEIYKRYDLHMHIPEGATPKDGPSAGITMCVAIASILTNLKVRSNVAMTGEITLSGKVLPIGGLKEKLIAAHNSKIKEVLIPKKNYERDLDEIPQDVIKSLKITPVSHIKEVLEISLCEE